MSGASYETGPLSAWETHGELWVPPGYGGVSMAEAEASREVEVVYVGRLGELDLGNPEGIPSPIANYTPEELRAYGEKLKEALVPVTDETHVGCIDGRRIIRNADGSAPEVRHRQVSGTGAHVEEARNAEAPVVAEVPDSASIGEEAKTYDQFIAATLGIKPSAHKGGCGGANGAIEDNVATATQPRIIKATEMVISHPLVVGFTNVPYSQPAGLRVVQQAGQTANHLRTRGWDGQAYVDGTQQREPAGTEILETAPKHKFNGHTEAALVLVLSKDRSISEVLMEQLGLGEVFVWSMKPGVDKARAFAGERGLEGLQQALIANVAKHAAVAGRLPSDQTPFYIIKDY